MGLRGKEINYTFPKELFLTHSFILYSIIFKFFPLHLQEYYICFNGFMNGQGLNSLNIIDFFKCLTDVIRKKTVWRH